MTVFDFASFPLLRTDRLVLRQMTDDDLAAVHAIFGDAESCRYFTVQNCEPYATPEETKANVLDWAAWAFAQGKGLRWGLTLVADGLLIGTAGINWWDRDNHCAEIGYDLNRQYWGQGLMTEAVHAILRWGFAHMALHRIEADTTEGNFGSMRVLEKCGFVLEGTARERHFAQNRYWHNLRYGLLRRDYEARFNDSTIGRPGTGTFDDHEPIARL